MILQLGASFDVFRACMRRSRGMQPHRQFGCVALPSYNIGQTPRSGLESLPNSWGLHAGTIRVQFTLVAGYDVSRPERSIALGNQQIGIQVLGNCGAVGYSRLRPTRICCIPRCRARRVSLEDRPKIRLHRLRDHACQRPGRHDDLPRAITANTCLRRPSAVSDSHKHIGQRKQRGIRTARQDDPGRSRRRALPRYGCGWCSDPKPCQKRPISEQHFGRALPAGAVSTRFERLALESACNKPGSPGCPRGAGRSRPDSRSALLLRLRQSDQRVALGKTPQDNHRCP